MLLSTGPGPTAFTRTRGAKAWASVRVAVQSPAFEIVYEKKSGVSFHTR